MTILLDKNTKVLIQGVGRDGSFQAIKSIEYGTNVVSCVHPNRKDQFFQEKIPFFGSVREAVEKTGANAGVIYVPAPFAMDAIIEQIDSDLDVCVCITEGIPIHDMMMIKNYIKNKKTKLIGPNCPGIISPKLNLKMGIIPGNICTPGNIGIVSRSGTLTYEAIAQGGDPIHGISYVDILKMFEEDSETKAIVLIGEIGGTKEQSAAEYISSNVEKPVIFTIAGSTAPPGKRMGHAGAVINGKMGLASEKILALQNAGAYHAEDPSKIGETIKQIL